MVHLHESRASTSRRIANVLHCGVSATAMGMMTLALPAFAQTTPSDAPATETKQADDIVVTGIRASLAKAQQIKKESDTVVDAITAQDIGALPDRSVTEALQRVPGVSISRFAGSNDPDHFSVEGSGVVIRGLNFVRSEFNGRDSFAAGIGGQSLNFADVPAELLGSVEVYKNVTAAAIEGGLAGTVNLNTRKPFDNKGLHVGLDAEANYGDFEKKWSPTGSILISDTWETGAGTFGLLGDYSYSRIRSRADGIQVTNFQARDNSLVPLQSGGGALVCRNPLPTSTDTSTLPPANSACGAGSTPGSDGLADNAALRYAPIGGQFRTQDFDRKRDGIAVAAQYESTDRSVLLTGQFIRSHTTNSWGEHTFEDGSDLSQYNTYPKGCQQNGDGPNGTVRAECAVGGFNNFQYDNNGLFQSGYIVSPGTGYRTNQSGSGTNFFPSGGSQLTNSRRQVFEENTVSDYGFNAQLHPSERLSVNLDFDYTKSVHTNFDVGIYGSNFADQEVNLTGNLPTVITHKPTTLQAGWATPNTVQAAQTDAQYFADPNATFYRAAIDHFEDSRGDEKQVAANFTYDLGDGGVIEKVKFGARFADRDQTVKYSAYNWGMLSEVWAGYPVSVTQAGASNSQFYNFPDFFRGATPGPSGAYYYGGDIVNNYDGFRNFVNSVEGIARTQNGNNSQQFVTADKRPGAIAGTPYLPSEVSRIKQNDTEAYVMLPFKFAGSGGRSISGNIGVRYVNTEVRSFSNTAIPTLQSLGLASQSDPTVAAPYDTRCAPVVPAPPAPPGPATRPGGVCLLGAAGYAQLVAFAGTTATFTPTYALNQYHYFLPSFNLKLSATDKLQFRLAASKVITRPDTGLTRPYQSLSIDGNGNFQNSVGNPYLKPATAWQFDATAEWYFSRVGSLTVDVFYKDVSNFFFSSVVNSAIQNNGVTFNQLTRGPANYTGHGKIKGAEIAYQQTFSFLPGLLNGFGFSGNYSYIQSSGLPNSFLNGGVAVTNVNAATQPGRLPLEGLSKHNVNATLFYEKGPVSLRAAYNYRSKYLLTAADVIYPFSSIFQDASGQVDASAFFSLNKYIKLGVQGVNLNNSVTKTLQAYTSDPNLLAPRSYFVNDRRYSFILRANF